MKWRYRVGLVVFAVAGFLLLFTQRGAFYTGLHTLKLVPEPEHFTELYIDNYTKLAPTLPKQILTGSTVAFTFVIHNLEGKTVTYPYVVYMRGSDSHGTTTILSKSVTLEDGGQVSVPVSYTFQSAKPPVSTTVFVSLTGQNQTLHIFIPNKD